LVDEIDIKELVNEPVFEVAASPTKSNPDKSNGAFGATHTNGAAEHGTERSPSVKFAEGSHSNK
jgi:hypothetical protein